MEWEACIRELKERAEMYSSLRQWMEFVKKEEEIDAIVAYNDRVAIEIFKALDAEGIRVPEDISLTGFDDSEFAKNLKVPLTTVRHPQSKIGEVAADLLVKLMKGYAVEEEKIHIVMEPELVIRNSTACRK